MIRLIGSAFRNRTLSLLGSLCIAACASGNYAPVVYHQFGGASETVAQDDNSAIQSTGDPSMRTARMSPVQSEPLGITGATLPPPSSSASTASSAPIEAEQLHSIAKPLPEQSADLTPPPVQVSPAQIQPAQQEAAHPLVTAEAPAQTANANAGPQAIIVKPGETLFSVGRTYRVSRQAVIDANNLKAPYALKIGSRLIIPNGDAKPFATAMIEPASSAPVPTAAPVQQVAATPTPAPQSVASSAPVSASSSITSETSIVAASASDKTHTVAKGETLMSISRNEHVRFTDLIEINKLAKPYHVRVGQELKLSADAPSTVAANPPAQVKETHVAEAKPVETKPARAESSDAHAEGGPLLHLGESPVAPASAPQIAPQQANIAAPAGKHEFIWPVSGRILSAFGPKESGRRNDGINISATPGTAVRAARAGEVIYVGNELRGYGNLVLIRHDDGYVSAYAHNSRVLVERGTFVQQGQEIAQSGATGSVDAPQVHFEIRKNRKPVDPLNILP
ncbi:MAG: LysM peptidoglycan-binding domain-containing M23 family metallopeptidase, partial [Alphaproteobacteria bacterium]